MYWPTGDRKPPPIGPTPGVDWVNDPTRPFLKRVPDARISGSTGDKTGSALRIAAPAHLVNRANRNDVLGAANHPRPAPPGDGLCGPVKPPIELRPKIGIHTLRTCPADPRAHAACRNRKPLQPVAAGQKDPGKMPPVTSPSRRAAKSRVTCASTTSPHFQISARHRRVAERISVSRLRRKPHGFRHPVSRFESRSSPAAPSRIDP